MNATAPTPPTQPTGPVGSKPKFTWKIVSLYVVVAAVIGACVLSRPPSKANEAGVVMKLPDSVLGFTGKDEPVSEAERVILPADTEIKKKTYTNSDGQNIGFQIVLSGVDRRSIHRPEICLVGQGWKVQGGQVVSIPLKSGKDLKVMVLDIARPVQKNGETVQLPALYAYWFVSADAETPYHIERLTRTNIDLLSHNRAHRWAYVIAMAPILKGFTPGGKDRAETLALIENFIRETVPYFEKTEMNHIASAGSR